ncbi:16S rRNA (guanine(966)-N(2))-methyltransferase RsmD [Marinimicrobium sp. ABcell2]|uniref:16S rRNA (guanine(966)-N(2))-methyltransferase RsmD n=1 Tax=Marinimicrobium sp. ABcell2 TaxID=3069751 RepID=UPI0027B13075|nr:16S rRNA (guanine(966)-N(2))-methyltransferase RsmD [Marinimicrobium sp. ABcell2]MDQ2076672.1 16S rRNA (guanine(966)-N(2))-methyltransferase RsmD [Marinimicrobium sp. ABcell2]
MLKAKQPQAEKPLRIIGGRWRGRKLNFPAIEGLRPTGDRIRETLFNWLAPHLPGARCLDLFAGSGALGLEALSRGAGEVVLLEKSAPACEQLRSNLALLQAEGATLINEDSLQWLSRADPGPGFDVVFLDPPFEHNFWQASIEALHARGWLAPGAAIYVESGQDTPYEVPESWTLHRDKSAGQVCYRLYWLDE